MPTTVAKYFAFAHLPAHLQKTSKPIGELATLMETQLPDGPEKSAGMRKLLEAKDCFVRAALDTPKEQSSILSTYQERVITEKMELDTKLKNLMGFIADNLAFTALSGRERDLLTSQAEAMTSYSVVLEKRIDAFKEQHHAV